MVDVKDALEEAGDSLGGGAALLVLFLLVLAAVVGGFVAEPTVMRFAGLVGGVVLRVMVIVLLLIACWLGLGAVACIGRGLLLLLLLVPYGIGRASGWCITKMVDG